MDTLRKQFFISLLFLIFLLNDTNSQPGITADQKTPTGAIIKFMESSEPVKSDLLRSNKKRFARRGINFYFDTACTLVAGCSATDCDINNIRIKNQFNDNTADKIPVSKTKMNVFCSVVELPGGRYFVDLFKYPDRQGLKNRMKTAMFGDILSYILEIKNNNVSILQKRDITSM
jgi:hypothetical protein